MSGSVAVTLPCGLWREGACRRDAELRPVTGAEEAFLAEEGLGLLPAERTTELLARCLVRLGPERPVAAEAVRDLTIGDREALLLHLRRLTFGGRLELVVDCPAEGCGEPMDVTLTVADLLVERSEAPSEWHEATVQTSDSAVRARFRLPTGADQEAAARLVPDVERATASLFAACVAGEVPAAAAESLPDLMAESDLQAEVVLDLECPACGHAFAALFDAGDFLERELAAGRERLFEDVHRIARGYGWREDEILALTPPRRQLYAALLLTEGAA